MEQNSLADKYSVYTLLKQVIGHEAKYSAMWNSS